MLEKGPVKGVKGEHQVVKPIMHIGGGIQGDIRGRLGGRGCWLRGGTRLVWRDGPAISVVLE